MNTQKASVRIAEPCHENWENMLPDDTGKFCLSCSKSVHDFTGKSDLEIHQTLMALKDERVCGRFRKTQLNRPLQIEVNLADLPANMSSTSRFALAVLLVFGSILFSCTDSYGQKMGEVTLRAQVNTPNSARELSPPDSLNTDVLQGDVKMIEAPVMGKMEYVVPELPPDTLKMRVDSAAVMPDIEPLYMGGISYVPEPPIVVEKDSLKIQDVDLLAPEREEGLLVYPNPSSGDVRFTYSLKQASDVRLELFDEQGRLLKVLVDIAQQHSGVYYFPEDLSGFNTGTYLARLSINREVYTKKILIVH